MGRTCVEFTYKNRQYLKKIYCLLLCIVIGWRLYLLITYCFHQTDIDQALMWYGTAEAGHFVFPEPHFYGQNYGSMMDSYLAVPLYWLHIPFNIALPLMVSLSCIAAFLIISLALFQRGYHFQSIVILMILGLNSWRWDINTSIPRSFISGFLFAVIGLVLINESDRKVPNAIGAFIAGISVSMTMTSLAILGIGISGIFLGEKERLLKKWKSLALGGVFGLLCIGLVSLFYILHPEHVVLPGLKLELSVDALEENMGNLFWTLSNFLPVPSGRAALCMYFSGSTPVLMEMPIRTGREHPIRALRR